MNGITGAYRGFVEGYFDGDPARGPGSASLGLGHDYGAIEARQVRYALYWSMYRNTTYRNVRQFAQQYKGQYGLYRHTRGVYSPSKRIADFARAYVWGGSLDPAAGDGGEVESAVPIRGADAATRESIARFWWDVNFESRKGIATLWGAVLGDVFLGVRPDPTLGRMALDIIHPGTITYVEKDGAGDILAYQRRERRADPDLGRPDAKTGAVSRRDVEFLEEASIEAGRVVYRTYRDGRPYDWSLAPDGLAFGTRAGARPEWDTRFDWIPLYHVQHLDEGLGWGGSEYEGGRAKIDECNDLGSKLHDQIRKMVEGAWLFAGMTDPKSTAKTAPRTPASARNPEPGRQELKVLYEPKPDARPWSLVGDLDVAATSAELRQSLDSLEDDYPELRFERLRLGGTVSGEALRRAQQPAAAKIQERRAAYDYALACVQMSAAAIGSDLGFDGYSGPGLASYSATRPSHRVGRRPVFAPDPADRISEKSARFAALKVAREAGVPLEVAMADLGWSKSDVAEVKRLQAEAAAKVAPAPNDGSGKAPARQGEQP